jgi:hypothetical protein
MDMIKSLLKLLILKNDRSSGVNVQKELNGKYSLKQFLVNMNQNYNIIMKREVKKENYRDTDGLKTECKTLVIIVLIDGLKFNQIN